MNVTPEQLTQLQDCIESEAMLVEDMAILQQEGLERLSEHFVHEEFVALVGHKRSAMEELANGRQAMKPLTELWIQGRTLQGLTHQGVESALEHLRQSFDRLRAVEDQLEGLATAYLAKLAEDATPVEERIRMHRSWL